MRKENHQAACDADIKKTEQRMADLQEDMDNALDNRNAQNKEFKDALKADTDAVMLLAKTIEGLSKYYVKNGLGLVQKHKKHQKKHRAHKEDPEYTTSDDTPPAADFSSATSSSSQNSGIVGIIENIKEDLEKE